MFNKYTQEELKELFYKTMNETEQKKIKSIRNGRRNKTINYSFI